MLSWFLPWLPPCLNLCLMTCIENMDLFESRLHHAWTSSAHIVLWFHDETRFTNIDANPREMYEYMMATQTRQKGKTWLIMINQCSFFCGILFQSWNCLCVDMSYTFVILCVDMQMVETRCKLICPPTISWVCRVLPVIIHYSIINLHIYASI